MGKGEILSVDIRCVMRDAGIMRTTLDIDDDVLQAAKEIAQVQGKTAGQMVSELLRKALAPRARAQRVRNGVPLLNHRPGAPVMTVAFVNELLDEE
jgi:Arc/MetJ family transcription regulator